MAASVLLPGGVISMTDAAADRLIQRRQRRGGAAVSLSSAPGRRF